MSSQHRPEAGQGNGRTRLEGQGLRGRTGKDMLIGSVSLLPERCQAAGAPGGGGEGGHSHRMGSGGGFLWVTTLGERETPRESTASFQ